MIWRVESDLVAMYREHGLETRVSLRKQCFRPGGSNQQLSVQRMSVYIDRFYSEGSLYQCSKFPVIRSSMKTKNDYGWPEFVTKLSEWRPEIFFYPDAEIYSFQVLWVDFPKLPLKMAIKIKLQINDHRNFGIVDIWPESNTDAVSGEQDILSEMTMTF